VSSAIKRAIALPKKNHAHYTEDDWYRMVEGWLVEWSARIGATLGTWAFYLRDTKRNNQRHEDLSTQIVRTMELVSRTNDQISELHRQFTGLRAQIDSVSAIEARIAEVERLHSQISSAPSNSGESSEVAQLSERLGRTETHMAQLLDAVDRLYEQTVQLGENSSTSPSR
jgi:hypothetical protein